MPQTIILIRHAQAEHNVDQDYSIRDPPLTELGHSQTRRLRARLLQDDDPEFPESKHIELVVVSALRRTLQTAVEGLGELTAKGVKFIAKAEIQEMADLPCDRGSKTSVIAPEFPQVDFSEIPEGWNTKKGPWAPTHAALRARAIAARRYLHSRQESVIAVVTHSAFLSFHLGPASLDEYENCEYRVCEWQNDGKDEECLLVEKETSVRRRREKKPLEPKEEIEEARETTRREAEAQKA